MRGENIRFAGGRLPSVDGAVDTRPRLPSLPNASRSHTNPYGSQPGPCNLRLLQRLRLPELFEGLAADNDPALALPNAEFALRTNADVLKVNTDGSGKEAIGVTYVDAQGGEVEQPAAMVILAAFHLHNSSCNAKPTFGAQAPVSRRVRDPSLSARSSATHPTTAFG